MLGAKGLTHDFKLKANLNCTLYCYGELSYVLISFIKNGRKTIVKFKLSLICTPSYHLWGGLILHCMLTLSLSLSW